MSAQIDTLTQGGHKNNSQTATAKKGKDQEALVSKVFNRLNVQLLHKVSDMLANADSSLKELSESAESPECGCGPCGR